MATSNTALRVADLDFFSIKENLKNYLRGQDTFLDYDFEGSGMSVLLDLLSYNTYYNAYYMNMIANEAFLDTAQIRQNILSHAKVINYVPTSSRGAQAKINVKVTPSASEDSTKEYITLKKYTRLLGTDIDGINYPFTTLYSNTVPKTGNTYDFSNVIIKQGEAMVHQFMMMANNVNRSFEIPSANVDTSTLSITVQESISNTQTHQYTLASDLTDLKSDSRVYFLEENDNLNYTVYFGDNVLGMRPKNGSIIIATYVDTVGSVANNVNKFVFIDKVYNLYRDNVKVTTVETSRSGLDKETVEQIKFRAPYAYSTQNRAVTINDYQTLILKDYQNIDAISVWGGEDNDPPMYGKVFISLKTKGYYALSNLDKENIKKSLINNRNILTVTPEIIDPDYVFVQVVGKITYNPNLTSKDPIQLIDDVRTAIGKYNNEQLSSFNSTFKKATLQNYMESADPSITSSDINIYLQKRIPVLLNTNKTYRFSFNAPLRKGDYVNKLFSFPQIIVNDSRFIPRTVYIEETPSSFTGIDSINIISSGINYELGTTVIITGDGTGASAEPVIINGKLSKVNIINRGINYTRATVTIVSDAGNGATAIAILESRIGTLRTYYYQTNGEKIILNDNAGTINYDTGAIELTAIKALNVATNDFYDANILAVSAVPQSQTISPQRNRIITIDMDNFQSIQLEAIAQT